MRSTSYAAESAALPAAAPERSAEGTMGVCVDRLDRVGAQLQQTSKQIEHAVVEVCERFNSIAMQARAETARLMGLLATKGPPEGDSSFEHLLRACSGTLLQLLTLQTKSNEMIAAVAGRLHEVNESASKIEELVMLLEQISHGNRLLALNARIEASRLPEQERGFNAVAVELSEQTKRTNQLTDGISDVSRFLKKLAEDTAGDLMQMQTESTDAGTRIRKDADRTIDGLSGAYQAMRQAVGRSQVESSLLADNISAAVRGLQFQDRVGQQLAHVVHDLQVIQKLMRESSAVPDASGNDACSFSDMAMHEERAIYGTAGPESLEGDIELF